MSNCWDLKKIKDGFERFRIKNGRLPIAPEIDELDYLPSARQLQRKFGGLEKLRKHFGYKETHFGKGSNRIKIAIKTNKKGRETEILLEKILKNKFGEVFVHTEKIFDDSKNRVDFFIYSPDGNFGIDVFYTETMRDLQKNINIKINKYQKFPNQLFFVVGNEKFKQEDLDNYQNTKTKKLPENTNIIVASKLIDIVKNRRAYPNPLENSY